MVKVKHMNDNEINAKILKLLEEIVKAPEKNKGRIERVIWILQENKREWFLGQILKIAKQKQINMPQCDAEDILIEALIIFKNIICDTTKSKQERCKPNTIASMVTIIKYELNNWIKRQQTQQKYIVEYNSEDSSEENQYDQNYEYLLDYDERLVTFKDCLLKHIYQHSCKRPNSNCCKLLKLTLFYDLDIDLIVTLLVYEKTNLAGLRLYNDPTKEDLTRFEGKMLENKFICYSEKDHSEHAVYVNTREAFIRQVKDCRKILLEYIEQYCERKPH